MADQLRWDYLSCYGEHEAAHAEHRPHRKNGRALQSRLCSIADLWPEPDELLYWTLCAFSSAAWNGIPLRIGEQTLGDHLRELEVSCVLVGKTHMVADAEGMKRLGIRANSFIGVRVKECGFEVFERDDGLHPDGNYDPIPDMTITCARMAWMVIIPAGGIGQFCARQRWAVAVRLVYGKCAFAGACAGGIRKQRI